MEECLSLIALYYGVSRLATALASLRTTDSTTSLGSVTLRAGGKVLLPFCQKHFNEMVLGDNADRFDAERLLRDKNLSESMSFCPFDDGFAYCPGRNLARREVLVFIVLTVQRFDIRLQQQISSKLDTMTPSAGIMMPMAGENVRVMLRRF